LLYYKNEEEYCDLLLIPYGQEKLKDLVLFYTEFGGYEEKDDIKFN